MPNFDGLFSVSLVMEYHYDRDYRGEHWPLVLLEGLCARWANQIIDGRNDMDCEPDSLSALGVAQSAVEKLWEHMHGKLEGIRGIAALFLEV